MTDFLVRKFVKNYEQTEIPQVRTAYGLMASVVGICCNLLLFLAKLTTGMAVRSISVMADAFNNLSDAASSIIGFVGVKWHKSRQMTTILLVMAVLNILLRLLWRLL